MTVLHRNLGLLTLSALFIVGFGFSLDQNSGSHPQNFKVPVIIGMKDTTSLCLSPAYMLNAWYDVERIDRICDTLDLNSEPSDLDRLGYQCFISDQQMEMPISNKGLVVIADTINELTMTKKPIWARFLFFKNFGTDAEILQDDTLIQQVKSFPIFVVNTSFDNYAFVETQDGSLILIVEARNREGVFQPIEYWSHSWCGNSYFYHLLKPRHMIMSRGIKCSGDFHTQCRLKLYISNDSIYSNEFFMSINETQFENPIEKDGY